MRVTIDPALIGKAPGLTLGVAAIDGVRVREPDAALAAELDAAIGTLLARPEGYAIADDSVVQAVRALYRATGMDPTRYRPASEALLRRALQGKGVPQVNTVVDVNNLHSLVTRWPWGVYNRARIEGDVVYRLGQVGESYVGIGKPALDVAGKLILADSQGPFGSPTSDSERTQVTLSTTDLLWAVFAPPGTSETALDRALDDALARLRRYNGGQLVWRAIAR
jgi:DNA/RNA-binding domain of Phe-tRNA-synthetase-like protein